MAGAGLFAAQYVGALPGTGHGAFGGAAQLLACVAVAPTLLSVAPVQGDGT